MGEVEEPAQRLHWDTIWGPIPFEAGVLAYKVCICIKLMTEDRVISPLCRIHTSENQQQKWECCPLTISLTSSDRNLAFPPSYLTLCASLRVLAFREGYIYGFYYWKLRVPPATWALHSLNQQADRRGHGTGQGMDPERQKEIGLLWAVEQEGLRVNPGHSLECLLVPLA